MIAGDSVLMGLMRAIIDNPIAAARLLGAAPELALAQLGAGASRLGPKGYFFDAIKHYVYADDTALHVAGAAHRHKLVGELLALGADVHARNRRGAEPLHYAVDGGPGIEGWDPGAQARTVARLIEAGADPNAIDKSGVSPLHRAVRTRCAAAVEALLEGGADPRRKNKNGSTPMDLATHNTGRSASGSPESKEQQKAIIRLLERRLKSTGAAPT